MIESLEEGRKEDGNRSIADKILKCLTDSQKTIRSNYGRWAWELLQNAKDSVATFDDRKVSVEIELSDNDVVFRHNGGYFTEKDIRGLINQISSKEAEEEEEVPEQHRKKTGKFGTGFITTHLLSRKVQVKGILKASSGRFYKFNFLLDREGKTTKELAPKIEDAWITFHRSYQEINGEYDQTEFNTSFRYIFAKDEQRKTAKTGIKEFKKLIPFVLVFNPKIHSINLLTEGKKVYYEIGATTPEGITEVTKKTQSNSENLWILHQSNGDTTVATQLMVSPHGYALKDTSDFPKLFCDFPLIGTENFPFPIIVNSAFFNPLTERNSIWLENPADEQVRENQNILEEAVQLFENLIDMVVRKNFSELYHIAQTNISQVDERYLNLHWYKANIQKPLRDIVFKSNLVALSQYPDKATPQELWFPASSYSTKTQQALWSFMHDLNPRAVCKQEHLELWNEVAWGGWQKLNYEVIAQAISARENTYNLAELLGKSEQETIEWLNAFYKLLVENNQEITLRKVAIVPNQKGVFKTTKELFVDDVQDETLVQILQLLGEDWEEILIETAVFIRDLDLQEKPKKDITTKITDKIKKVNNENAYLTTNQKAAFILLYKWFDDNEVLGKELFSFWYQKKQDLFVSTIEEHEKAMISELVRDGNLEQVSVLAQKLKENPNILSDISKNQELSDFLDKHEAKDLEELDSKIEIGNHLAELLQDKDYSLIFGHISNPKFFPYAQEKLERVRENVQKHLAGLDEYNLDNTHNVADTIIAGVKKDGQDISIITRPSDGGVVIIYYDIERDVLDYDASTTELWVEDGNSEPKQLTLGSILKMTGIIKFPVNESNK